MLQLITPDRYGEFIDDLAEMHRLRYRVFKERLGWDVQASGDMEVDEFDACRPVYLLQRDDDGRVQGCVRLLPTAGPTMLRDTFPALLDGQSAPASDVIWESSRFGVDLCTREAKTAGSIARATYELQYCRSAYPAFLRLISAQLRRVVRHRRVSRKAAVRHG